MKNSFSVIMSIGMVFFLVLVSCAAGTTTAPPIAEPKVSTPGPVPPARQERWEKTVAESRKEGTVAIYGNLTGTARADLSRAFGEKYGIGLEVTAGRAEPLLAKIEAERRAGLYLGDIFLSGGSSALQFRQAGLLDPLEPALILSEVLDPKAWIRGRIGFIDQQRTMIAFFIHAGSTIIVNTNLVNPQEIKSYKDLLSPRWKGKIVMENPTVSGAGASFFAYNIMETMGIDFAHELIKQDLKIISDARLLVEWVAKGSYPIAIAPTVQLYQEFKAAGAPLKFVIPVEGTYSVAGAGAVALLNKAAHPNAAAVFINWLLTKEGQTVAVKAYGDQSRRLDVTTEYIDDDRRIQPGVKYLEADNEEIIQKGLAHQKLAKEIFAPLMK